MTKLRSILFVTAFGLTAMLPAQASDMGMASAAKPSAQMAHAEGVIKALDAKAGTVTLAHGPVQELKMARDDHGVQAGETGAGQGARRREESEV